MGYRLCDETHYPVKHSAAKGAIFEAMGPGPDAAEFVCQVAALDSVGPDEELD